MSSSPMCVDRWPEDYPEVADRQHNYGQSYGMNFSVPGFPIASGILRHRILPSNIRPGNSSIPWQISPWTNTNPALPTNSSDYSGVRAYELSNGPADNDAGLLFSSSSPSRSDTGNFSVSTVLTAGTTYTEFDHHAEYQDTAPPSQAVASTSSQRSLLCNVPDCKVRTTFTRISDLNRHIKSKHSNDSFRHVCGCCKYSCIRKDHMKQHIKKKHRGLEMHACSCGQNFEMNFSSLYCLLIHKRATHALDIGAEGNSQGSMKAAEKEASSTKCECFPRSSSSFQPLKRRALEGIKDTDETEEDTLADDEALDSDNSASSHSSDELNPHDLASSRSSVDSQVTTCSRRSDLSLSSSPDLVFTTSFGILSDEEKSLTTEDVKHVRPAQFLFNLGAFLRIESSLIRMTTTLTCVLAEQAHISYDFFKSRLRIDGPKIAVQKARQKVEETIQETCTNDKPRIQRSPADNAQVFPLKRNTDSRLITAWEEHVLPSLSETLRPHIGNDYTACLIREGLTVANSQPCIQIESADRVIPRIRKLIKEGIRTLFREQAGVGMPKLQFYRGQLTYLVDDSSSDEAEDYYDDDDDGKDVYVPEVQELVDEDEEDEDDSEDKPFFEPEKWYTKKVGMSDSVGPLGNLSVSATIGGYVIIEDQLYLLLVNHFVSKCVQHLGLPSGIGMKVTSPSLADIDDAKQYYRAEQEKYRNQAENVLRTDRLSDGFQPVQDIITLVSTGGLEELKHRCRDEQHREAVDKYVNAIFGLQNSNQTEEALMLGTVAYRCSDDDRPKFRKSRTPKPGRQGNDRLKMDWALVRVSSEHRVGGNRHRYRPTNKGDVLNYDDEEHPGSPCDFTCSLKPQARVHYVGRSSGLQCGTMSPTRMLVVKDNRESSEWYIIPNHKVEEDKVKGDSGAWVIRTSNNRLMAQLWGLVEGVDDRGRKSGGKLPVSPISEIFEDIKQKTRAQNIELLRNDNWPQRGALPHKEICEDKDEQPTKRRTKKPKVSTMSMVKHYIKDAPPESLPPIPLVVHRENTPPDTASDIHAPLRLEASLLPPPPPASPVPSLVSSNSSDSPLPDRTTFSSSPSNSDQRSPCTPVYPSSPLLKAFTAPYIPVKSSEPQILNFTDSRNTVDLSDEPEPITEPSTPSQNPKLSVRFVLRDEHPPAATRGLNFLDKFSGLEMPKPIRPLRKSVTLPLFKEFSHAMAHTAPIVAPAQ